MEEIKDLTSVQQKVLEAQDMVASSGTKVKLEGFSKECLIEYLDKLIGLYEDKLVNSKGDCKYPEGRIRVGGKLDTLKQIKADINKRKELKKNG